MNLKFFLFLVIGILAFLDQGKPIMAAGDVCTKVNVLMYHHIQEWNDAKNKKQTGLTTTPQYLRKHFQYLKDKKYNVISPLELSNFFDGIGGLPSKPVILTFDDAKQILKDFGYKLAFTTRHGVEMCISAYGL